MPAPFGRWWDEETLDKTRKNESEAGKSEEQIEEIISKIQTDHPRIPDTAILSEKPKNDWNELVLSMRQ